MFFPDEKVTIATDAAVKKPVGLSRVLIRLESTEKRWSSNLGIPNEVNSFGDGHCCLGVFVGRASLESICSVYATPIWAIYLTDMALSMTSTAGRASAVELPARSDRRAPTPISESRYP